MRLQHQAAERDAVTASQDSGNQEHQRALRQRGAALAAAADDAINRALSRNSSEFLAQNRQSGGQ
jgi:hypothetical protein